MTWLGQRVVDPAAVQRPAKAMPVRIRMSALGENLPQRDLLVSPDTACSLMPGRSPAGRR
ncbi:Hint domain-containing protein [Teichococcus vastitatis]|uniref:Hint domain-containing protein n=1 Tax=Teichococcus vastitatis TaxID=2307076 RepID=UPI002367A87A|nr:Hint domain-containing protein [Pseudoroseomonas vastitatis]